MKNIAIYIVVFIIISAFMPLYAQVGVITHQPQASLHVTPSSTNGNTVEGIIAPSLTRSQLIGKDDKYTTFQAGILVYITSLDGIVTAKTANVTSVGFYYFDGNIWKKVDKQGRYFHLPTFTLPINSVGTDLTFDIYNNVYKKQFDKAMNPQYTTSNQTLANIPEGRYAATELDYVVTYYDEAIMKINSISTSGVINYDVLSTELGPSSFINVVLVTK